MLLKYFLRKFTHLVLLCDAEFKAQRDNNQNQSHVAADVFARKSNSRLPANLIFPENLFPKVFAVDGRRTKIFLGQKTEN